MSTPAANEMKFRHIGSSDLEVSVISLGSWLTYSGGVEADQTRACTEAAFDAGINFFDTANVYGRGAAEEAWGAILSEHPRDSYVLATKVWGPMSDDPADRGLAPEQIGKQIDASLRRLRTDHVDLYQAHRFDSSVPIEDTLEALQQVVTDGKARYLGFSEWTPEQIRTAIEIAGPELFVSSQPQYSMLWQAPEAEVFDVCTDAQISQIVWSPLAQGILTGKYSPGQDFPAGSRFAHAEMGVAKEVVLSQATLEAAQRLQPVAEEAGLSMTHLALAWVLRRPELASAIIGASRPEQVHDNAAAAGVSPSDDVWAAVDAALGDVPVTGQTLGANATAGILRR